MVIVRVQPAQKLLATLQNQCKPVGKGLVKLPGAFSGWQGKECSVILRTVTV